MVKEDRNQTTLNTVVDYRLIVQRDILLSTEGSAKFQANFAYLPQIRRTLSFSHPPRICHGFG